MSDDITPYKGTLAERMQAYFIWQLEQKEKELKQKERKLNKPINETAQKTKEE